MKRSNHFAFTLVELLVVIAIIGILIAMMLPAIQSSRESARRASCTNNVVQLGIALASYEMANQSYPSGTIDSKGPIQNIPKGNHINWLVQILPYLDENSTYNHIDLKAGVYDPKNAEVRSLRIALFECPSYCGQQNPAMPMSNYAGCHNDVETPIDENNNGVLFLNSHVKTKDITDGLANTIFVGEKSGTGNDLGWMSGTRATIRNTGTALNLTLLDDAPGRLGPRAAPAAAPETTPAPDSEQPADPNQPVATKDVTATKVTTETKDATETPTQADATKPDAPAQQATKPSEKSTEKPAEKIAEKPSDKPAETSPPSKTDSDLYVGGFGSYHPYGVNFLFGDGAVHFINTDIDLKLLQQLGNRADGKLLEGGPTRGQ